MAHTNSESDFACRLFFLSQFLGSDFVSLIRRTVYCDAFNFAQV